MMLQIMNGMTPAYNPSVFSLRILRRNLALPAVTYKTDYHRNSFAYTGAKIWNALPDEINHTKSHAWEFFLKHNLESVTLSIDI